MVDLASGVNSGEDSEAEGSDVDDSVVGIVESADDAASEDCSADNGFEVGELTGSFVSGGFGNVGGLLTVVLA